MLKILKHLFRSPKQRIIEKLAEMTGLPQEEIKQGLRDRAFYEQFGKTPVCIEGKEI